MRLFSGIRTDVGLYCTKTSPYFSSRASARETNARSPRKLLTCSSSNRIQLKFWNKKKKYSKNMLYIPSPRITSPLQKQPNWEGNALENNILYYIKNLYENERFLMPCGSFVFCRFVFREDCRETFRNSERGLFYYQTLKGFLDKARTSDLNSWEENEFAEQMGTYVIFFVCFSSNVLTENFWT